MTERSSTNLPAPAGCAGCAYTRRDFVSLGAGALAGLALVGCSDETSTGSPNVPPMTDVLPAGVTITGNTVSVDVAVANALTQSPGLLFIIGRTARPVLLVRSAGATLAAATYRGFNAACPHAGTTNQWEDAGADVICRNHNSQFNRSTGAVSVGPATGGLQSLPTTRTGNVVTVDAA